MNIKVVAFYLPQFHEIPENDQWWGQGFTEWTNTKKAKPLFKKHYQPHTPMNENYYCLLDGGVLEEQVKVAKKYGVGAFCYYHYWFANGKKLLEKPVENMLKNEQIEMPFCLCWANENWSRRWDGSENDILAFQDYDNEQGWIDHYNYLSAFFKDKRYLRDANNRPILLIYKPELIPNLESHMVQWNRLAREDGFNGICFICQYPQSSQNIEGLFDYHIDFEPLKCSSLAKNHSLKSFKVAPKYTMEVITSKLLDVLGCRKYKKYSYSAAIKASINRKMDSKTILGAFTGWDNTPRKGNRAIIYSGSTPELFGEYIYEQLKKEKQFGTSGMLFVNAWNEWAEGAHLEPDERWHFGYLEALYSALNKL